MRDGLPKGWTTAALAQLTGNPKQDIISGPFGSNLKSDEYVSEGVPIIRLQNVDRNKFLEKNMRFITPQKARELSAHNFRAGDVVITKLGDPLGKACTIPESLPHGIVVADVVRVRLDESRFSRSYVLFAINSPTVVNQINSEMMGSTRPRVNLNNIRDLQIPLAPVAEQRRIVAKLEALLGKVDASQQRLAKIPVLLKRFRQSVLAAACSGRLTADWREENLVTNGSASVGDGDLPSSWASCLLKDVASVTSGFAFSSRDFTDAGVPAIKISNVQYGEFIEKNQEYLPVAFLKQHPPFVVLPETLLMALTRPITNDTLKVCIYPKIAKPGLLNQRVCKFEPSERIGRDYLHLFMQTQPFKAQVQENLSETLQPNLSPKALDSFSVSLPLLPEQQEIVRRVEELFALADQLEVRLAKARGQVDKLTPSLLARAFAGQLVPQDPTDEPAEKLLERIRKADQNIKGDFSRDAFELQKHYIGVVHQQGRVQLDSDWKEKEKIAKAPLRLAHKRKKKSRDP